MNQLEKESLIGFIIIHYLRNPNYFKKYFEENIINTNIEYNVPIENIYKNNDLYGVLTQNILINQWYFIETKSSVFVLPDTTLFLKKEKEGHIILFPISPNYCLLITNEKDERKDSEKIIPIRVELDLKESLIITNFLIKNSMKEFISCKNIKDYITNEIDYNITYKGLVQFIKKLKSS